MIINLGTYAYIRCETREEQEKILDIFEMIGKKWWSGHAPRKFRSHTPPMYYSLDEDGFGQCYEKDNKETCVLARDLHNQWIQLCNENGRK